MTTERPTAWPDIYPTMRQILDDVIKAQRAARRPTHDVPGLMRVRRDLGQLDRGTHQPCTQSPAAWSSFAAFRLVREVINVTPLGHDATAAILRLAADLADQNNVAREALQGVAVPIPAASPVWAQRCSCGGQGITHLHAEHHEPTGPADVDPFAGRACELCGDYVTGPCPTCAPATVAGLARVRQIAPALDFEATAPGMHDAAREALRDASRRIRTALGTLREVDPLPRPAVGSDDACRVVEVDGEPIRVRGAGEMTDQDTAALAEVLGAARRKYAAEHPEAALGGVPSRDAARCSCGFDPAAEKVHRPWCAIWPAAQRARCKCAGVGFGGAGDCPVHDGPDRP